MSVVSRKSKNEKIEKSLKEIQENHSVKSKKAFFPFFEALFRSASFEDIVGWDSSHMLDVAQ